MGTGWWGEHFNKDAQEMSPKEVISELRPRERTVQSSDKGNSMCKGSEAGAKWHGTERAKG